MQILKALLRFFSYVFHALLCLVLLVLWLLAMISGAPTLQLGMLPWTGPALLYALLAGGLIGLLSLILALRGSMRWLFFLWSLAVFAQLVRGFFLGGYHFSPGEIDKVLYLLGGSFLSVLGALSAMTRRKAR